MKTDTLGNPLWTRSFSDTSRYIAVSAIYEDDDHSIYCMVNWKSVSSGFWNFTGLMIKMDSLGNILEMRDNLNVQSFRNFGKKSSNNYYALIQQGSSNNNDPAILVMDSTLNLSLG